MSPDHFDAIEDAFQDAARGLAQAHEGMTQAQAGIGNAIDSLIRANRLSKAARVEQEDLRVTVARLEGLVIELLAKVQTLEDRGTP